MEDDFRVAFLQADEVHDAGNLLKLGADRAGNLLENVHTIAEDFDLNGFGRAFEVAEHVLKKLGEFHVYSGNIGGDLGPHVVHDFFGGTAARTIGPARLKFDEDIAGILLRGVHAHFSAGAAVEGLSFWHGGDALFDLLEDAIGLVERCASGRNVVEDVAAFVHFGKKAGVELRIENGAEDDHGESSGGYDRAMRKRPADRAFIHAIDRLDEFRGFGAMRGAGKETKRKKRNNGERKNERKEDGHTKREAKRGKEFADDSFEKAE